MKNRPAKNFCLIALLALASDQTLRAQTNKSAVVESATNATVVLPPRPRAPTRIEADRADFDLATREATYFENVRVDDPDMKLHCEWLAANLPQAGGRVDHIVAKTNVVIDFTDEKGQPVHATGDKAVYSYQVQGGVTNETITLTGNPQIEDALGTQMGDEIIWDRVNNRMSIPKNAKMVSHQNLNGAMLGTNSPPATTNQLAAPK
jgi:lipopolysaccharide transport protein LptA